ncbi:MAG: tetratricopeptide repeat protein [Thiothrix sp.]|uniref:tetratricopeptide repeat protein n=1 Tax=Thiothrix sp. TaxID=1032 RepID=UPI00260EE46F|nr:tetratricopeptide repeat protein [Thiothrix sp.]MDD5394587.1 tetratricopeptide repeat protein [Thiothrix sp.]
MLRILLALVVCITCSQVNASFDDFKTKFKAYTDISSNAEAIREFDLGNQYADGDGLPRSDAQAFIWYEKSAKKGHPLAQSLVGAMYAEGKGTAVSQKKAAKWYQLAASQGHPLAQHNLGKMYEAGTGVSHLCRCYQMVQIGC